MKTATLCLILSSFSIPSLSFAKEHCPGYPVILSVEDAARDGDESSHYEIALSDSGTVNELDWRQSTVTIREIGSRSKPIVFKVAPDIKLMSGNEDSCILVTGNPLDEGKRNRVFIHTLKNGKRVVEVMVKVAGSSDDYVSYLGTAN